MSKMTVVCGQTALNLHISLVFLKKFEMRCLLKSVLIISLKITKINGHNEFGILQKQFHDSAKALTNLFG